MQVKLTLADSIIQASEKLDITVDIANQGNQPVRLNTLFLDFPSVVLQVRDQSGRRVPLSPPPIPPEDDGLAGREELAPATSISRRYSGRGLLGVPLAPGVYSVRFFFEAVNAGAAHDWEGTLQSDWMPFTILGTRR